VPLLYIEIDAGYNIIDVHIFYTAAICICYHCVCVCVEVLWMHGPKSTGAHFSIRLVICTLYFVNCGGSVTVSRVHTTIHIYLYPGAS
jgi:hypothetical protein